MTCGAVVRHVERAKTLVYVLDTAGVDGRGAWEDLMVLREELDKYLPGLSRRAGLIIANKVRLTLATANELPGHQEIPPVEEGIEAMDFLMASVFFLESCPHHG